MWTFFQQIYSWPSVSPDFHICKFNQLRIGNSIFNLQLGIPDVKDWLYTFFGAILYKGLEHRQILVSQGLLEPISLRGQGMTDCG